MGKPFETELQNCTPTLEWAQMVPITELVSLAATSSSLLTVGSGGAFTAAFFASCLHEVSGHMSRALTPLHITSTDLDLRDKSVLLLSAGGGNSDILSAFDTLVQREPRNLLALCMRPGTRLASRAQQFGIGECVEYDLPSGKDGFLAVNSLLAFCTLLHRAYFPLADVSYPSLAEPGEPVIPLEDFSRTVDGTLVVLHGFWGATAALDLESKCTEAGLVNVQLADFRNFAHGRHHWLAKHSSSSVVAFVTPKDTVLAQKTLRLLPPGIRSLVIDTPLDGPTGALQLLFKAFHLVKYLGQVKGIDPGRPGVPEFGRRLYQLRPMRTRHKADKLDRAKAPIERKVLKNTERLSGDELDYWLAAFTRFTLRLEKTTFGGVVFDYDGTLADPEHRFTKLPPILSQQLTRLLKTDIRIGVATGRGKSVRIALQNSLPAEYWEKVVIGYYNGGELGVLTDSSIPPSHTKTHPAIMDIESELKKSRILTDISILEVRPRQISLIPKNSLDNWPRIRDIVMDILGKKGWAEIKFAESSHSMDIIPAEISKLHLKAYLESTIKNPPQDILCIGDRGAWPGNDHSLLSTDYSLSVDAVSPDPHTCWNLAFPGFRGMRATLQYLSWLYPAPEGVRISIGGKGTR